MPDAKRVLVVADACGIEMLLPHIPNNMLCGIVGAVNRPHYHGKLKTHAARLGVPFVVQPRRKEAEYDKFVRTVLALRPDILLCNSYSMFIPAAIIESVGHAAINIHGGPLPEYRGCNPIQWAIINGDNRAGATMHLMTAQFDQGDIIGIERRTILPGETWLDVRRKVDEAVDSLLAKHLPTALSGPIKAYPQDEAKAKYWPHRRPEDGMIDFSRSCRTIYNLVRALVSPLPGAYYIDEAGEKVVFEKKIFLPEAIGLKSDRAGIFIDGVEFRPANRIPRENGNEVELIGFLEGKELGRIRVGNILSPGGLARIDAVGSSNMDARLAAAAALFCLSELEVGVPEDYC